MMKVVLGGMRQPMVPEQASVPTARVSSYRYLRISGRAMAAMAMAPERVSPTTAPNRAQATTLPMASPPRRCPIQLLAQL